MALPGYALAGPQGGTVTAGSATITQSGPATTINQSTNNAIINWQGFSIAPKESVTFNQPGVTSATLNRVTGGERSVIDGALSANGRVFIINQNGVLFGKNAQVNVGGLTASTLDIADDDFLHGKYTFQGSSAAPVVNQGHIRAGDGGYVALLGKTVSNDGVIVAKMGTVAMASGNKITLNFDGNSLIDVTIDQGTLNALVENKKAIKADGGRVILTAKAADAILSAQVNNTGIIQARAMSQLMGSAGGRKTRVTHKGSIKLLAQGGTVNVDGTLDASAPKGGDGGFIETSGDTVKIADSAVITTKSANGVSGTWLVDPTDFTIAAIGGDITGAALGRQLNSNGAVTFSSTQGKSGTDGNVNVNDKVTWSSGATLILNAVNAINVNAVLTAPNGGLALNAGTDVNINAPSSLQVATVNATAHDLALNPTSTTGDINFNAAQVFPAADGNFNGVNININDAVNWSAGTLTLNAGFNGSTPGVNPGPGFINLNAVMTASGTANLVVNYNPNTDTTTATGQPNGNPTETYGTPLGGITPLLDTDPTSMTFGTYIGRIDFKNIASANTNPLTINGANYTLITSLQQLDQLDNLDASVAGAAKPTNVTGHYALAADLDACGAVSAACASAVTYSNALISLGAGGVLEGLGHNVANFKFVDNTGLSALGNFGLIGTNAGTVRDISMTNVDITVAHRSGGALVGSNAKGTIINAAVSGGMLPDGTTAATGGISVQNEPAGTQTINGLAAGGLFGTLLVGDVYGAWADVHVSTTNVAAVGGLGGSVQASTGANVGGTIVNSTSIGTVEAHGDTVNFTPGNNTSGVGGLIGANDGGTLSHVSSSSTVKVGGGVDFVGALVGNNTFFNVTTRYGGSTFASVATGNVILDPHSTDVGTPGNVGGFAGQNLGLIDNSAFTGDAPPGAGFVLNNLGTVTNTGASPGQGPVPSNAQQAADARAQAQQLTQQATALQTGVVQAVAAASPASITSAAALTTSTSTPPGGDVSAGTRAASGSPASVSVTTSLRAVQDSVQADDRRVQRRPRVAAAAAPQRRRPSLGGSIRNIEINGRPVNP